MKRFDRCLKAFDLLHLGWLVTFDYVVDDDILESLFVYHVQIELLVTWVASSHSHIEHAWNVDELEVSCCHIEAVETLVGCGLTPFVVKAFRFDFDFVSSDLIIIEPKLVVCISSEHRLLLFVFDVLVIGASIDLVFHS